MSAGRSWLAAADGNAAVVVVVVVVVAAAVAVEVVVVPPAVGRSAGRLWQLGHAARSRACRRPQSNLKKVDQLHICKLL